LRTLEQSFMPTLIPPRFEGSIVLNDGRQLGYAEYGPTSGKPLLWFHGTPGARRQISPEAREAANERGVRIIAVERPGIGASTPHCYESIRDFARDIAYLASALELERFAVVGLSGGGPYALACASHMPDRVFSAGVLGGVAPAVGEDRVEGGQSTLMRILSPVVAYGHRPMGIAMRGLIRALEPVAERALDLFASFMPPGDKRVFEDERVRLMFVDDLLNGSEHFMQAALLDGVLFGRHWGFELASIRVPVHMWYGDADIIVPVEHGVHMSERIPDAQLRIRAEEGHLGGLGASNEILDVLLADWNDEGATPVHTPHDQVA
jgi:pimeloyl-ACP methyl ester carboxylesterase